MFSEIFDFLAPERKIQIKMNKPRDSQRTKDLRAQAKNIKNTLKRTNQIGDQRLLRNTINRLQRSIKLDNKEKLYKSSRR